MLFGWFYFDWTVLIVLPALVFTFWAQIKVNSSFEKYSRVMSRGHITGAEAARRILDANGLYDVKIERIAGNLTDHYDPRDRVVRLSQGTHSVATVAAVGIAAHEAGHAVQHATSYGALKLRNAILPVCRIGSAAAMPLFLIGLFLAADALMLFGILAYSVVTLFQLVTLPVEFNASRRAMVALERSGHFSGEEADGARCVLRAAAMTYVAALATSLLTLLRLLVLASGRRR